MNSSVVYLKVIVLGFIGVSLININTSTVFYWSLISSYYIHFNLQQGTLAISSSVNSSVSHYIHFNLRRGTLITSSSVGSSVSSLISSQISSSVGSSSTSSLGSSSSSYRYSFTTVVLKSIGPLGSYTLYISLSIPSSLNKPVHLPLYPVLPSL